MRLEAHDAGCPVPQSSRPPTLTRLALSSRLWLAVSSLPVHSWGSCTQDEGREAPEWAPKGASLPEPPNADLSRRPCLTFGPHKVYHSVPLLGRQASLVPSRREPAGASLLCSFLGRHMLVLTGSTSFKCKDNCSLVEIMSVFSWSWRS